MERYAPLQQDTTRVSRDVTATSRRWLGASVLLTLLLVSAAPLLAQGLQDRIEDRFGDGRSFTVYIANPLTVPVRILDLQVYDCIETGLGCGPGSGVSGIVINPGREEAVTNVTRAGCTNPVNEDGQVISDDCSKRPRTSFHFSYRFARIENTSNPTPKAPAGTPGTDSQSAARRAEQERLEQQRLELERQARQRQQQAQKLQQQRA